MKFLMFGLTKSIVNARNVEFVLFAESLTKRYIVWLIPVLETLNVVLAVIVVLVVLSMLYQILSMYNSWIEKFNAMLKFDFSNVDGLMIIGMGIVVSTVTEKFVENAV